MEAYEDQDTIGESELLVITFVVESSKSIDEAMLVFVHIAGKDKDIPSYVKSLWEVFTEKQKAAVVSGVAELKNMINIYNEYIEEKGYE
jgi:hypothetical protein